MFVFRQLAKFVTFQRVTFIIIVFFVGIIFLTVFPFFNNTLQDRDKNSRLRTVENALITYGFYHYNYPNKLQDLITDNFLSAGIDLKGIKYLKNDTDGSFCLQTSLSNKTVLTSVSSRCGNDGL